jgi:hypothetical protein
MASTFCVILCSGQKKGTQLGTQLFVEESCVAFLPLTVLSVNWGDRLRN